jgi:hypothetical protein
MVSETIIFPEMSDAGEQALKESRARGDDEATQAVMVYMAMAAVYEMFVVREQNTTRH